MQALNYIEKIVGKDNLEGFLKELKSALQTVEKQNEKSEVDISVKGGDDLNGIAAETFTISKEKYSEYITEEKDYMKDAVSIMTVKINAKDASTLPTLQTLIEAQKGMIMELPFVKEKGDKNIMKIAVTYENGEIFQHFGHTEQFKVYEVENGTITNAEVIDTNGSGHGALAGFLVQHGVDTLICGGIGGIRLYGGCSGNADDAVAALLAGSLGYNPNVRCNHHDHEGNGHTCGDHGCGSHSCH